MKKVHATAAEALDGLLSDDMLIAAGGFGLCGIPENLISAIRDSGTLCVFAEPQFDVGYVSTVIEGTGARAAQLDPIGIDPQTGPDAYLELLQGMADAIAGCLTGS